MEPIVSTRWLLARMYEPELVIVDCRFVLSDPEAGRIAYTADHIPGAIYLHLEEQLSAPVGSHGGRHPLPDVTELAQVFSKVGMNKDSIVVAYDDQGGAYASRLWWLLRYLGHERVYVMDEGYSAWKNAKFPVSDHQAVRIPSQFVADVQQDMVVGVEDVQEVVRNGGPLIIDSREHRRYLGLEEPIDAKAGHIPGAINKFWKDVLDEQGRWKKADALKEQFADIEQEQEVIVYCGSGVTACPNVLALTQAGYKNVKLYAGSWSDWISYEGNAVTTGSDQG
ncbi:sulfurtransferase [Paenibacillus wynnii]|uniref:3-mercaptopyruvate sulfurtransferase n=1 Tax=Paenibacillus wynnii TaxID=268407 RepID=A0A098M4E3_9BACL|nr:sulfurtransferase [Paenibacillus wynnii]KGE16893.1 3-mercaptopyruvate sulfurtransferase [Paenibacillus wynnii]